MKDAYFFADRVTDVTATENTDKVFFFSVNFVYYIYVVFEPPIG